MSKISVIIPTMQKDINILNMLVEELIEDVNVGEIIIIDNSLKGYIYKSDKINVFLPDKNMYVNPSWNYGISISNYEYFAILNDDIILPPNLFKKIIEFIDKTPECGVLGLESSSVMQANNLNYNQYPVESDLLFKPIDSIYSNKNFFWGSAIFGKKENYYTIPNELLIYSGDNYLIFMNKKNKKQNYAISNINVFHCGSLTSSSPTFKGIKENDMKFFATLDRDYRIFKQKQKIENIINKMNYNKRERIFSVKNSKDKKYKILCVFGKTIIIREITPYFSIIMPTYNRAFCIEKAINSLINQSYINWQLIIIDDGSTDNTQEIIENKYSKYINNKKIIYKYIQHRGVCNARNVGLKLSKYDWIAYLDSDNEMSLNFLETFEKAIIKNPNKKCFYAKFKKSDNEIKGKSFDFKSLCKRNYIDLGVFVHNKSLTKINGDFDTSLKRLVDWDLIVRYTRHNTPYFINKVLLNYNSNDDYQRITHLGIYNECRDIIYNKISNYIEKEKFIEKIFSIKNDDIHKVITIFGLKIKFKSKKLIFRKKIESTEKLLKEQSKQIKIIKEQNQKQNEEILNQLNLKNEQSQLIIKLLNNQENIAKAIQNKLTTQAISIYNIKSEINLLNTALKLLQTQIQKNKLKDDEIMYANIFRDCTSQTDWLRKKDFTLTSGAANYSFIYILFKILDEVKPQNILEFGLGQTSKLTSQYILNCNSTSKLHIVEHNQDWIDTFSKKLDINERIKIHKKDLIKFELNGIESDKYENLDDITNGEKFDLIIIDGPFGFERAYPRTNILDLIPNNLDDNFVIILDDAERQGEKNTANLIFNKLRENNIGYRKSYKMGTKKQLIITGENYEFLNWY